MLFVVLLWLAKAADVLLSLRLARFGVSPRDVQGLWGVLLGPLIHGSWAHIFTNTLPFFILTSTLFYGYPKSAKLSFALIYLGSGLGVWLFARGVYHIGISGVNYGLMFFIFVAGILRRDLRSIALSMMVFFLYGGMIWGIFPNDPRISFESHFFGALMGVVSAFLLRGWDQKPPEKKYDWESGGDSADDSWIGDQWRNKD